MPPVPEKPIKSGKIRIDQFLLDAGHCASKTQAQGMILAGQVKLDGKVVDKPGSAFTQQALEKALLEIEQPLLYVSRGGLKLEKALDEFGVNPASMDCLDVGASTGGFTDCLLQRGATSVHAVDAGHGQLDWKLRQDARVVTLEKTNIRHLTVEQVSRPISLCVMDISFISIKKALPTIEAIFQASLPNLPACPQLITLIKPQFEYKDYCKAPGFDGVVKKAEQHQEILNGLLLDIQNVHPALYPVNLSFSPITGPKGNIEFLLHMVYRPEPQNAPAPSNGFNLETVDLVIGKAHQTLITPKH